MNYFTKFFLLLLLTSQLSADGLIGKYYAEADFTDKKLTRIDSTIDFAWGNGTPVAAIGTNYFTVKWTGWIYFPEDSSYTFSLAHDDEIILKIDGEKLYDDETWTGGANNYQDTTSKFYTAGYYPIVIKFKEESGGAYAKFAWRNSNSITSRRIVPTTNLFTALPNNLPPSSTTIPDSSGILDTAYTYDVSTFFSQTDGDAITYSDSGNLPDGIFLNTATGILSGTPTTIGNYSNIIITGTDKDGATPSNTFNISIANLNIESNGGRNFHLRTQSSLFGDVRVIGNTVLCQKNSSGTCTESANNTANNYVNLQRAPESFSTLNLPTGAIIKYARIYWQGRKVAGSSWTTSTKAISGKIKIKKNPTDSFVELTADIKDFDDFGSIPIYSASADASSIVDSPGTYYIDTQSFYTHTGETSNQRPSDGLGSSGSWVLVVIYEDPSDTTARNITIFDGYKQVTSGNDASAAVSGFLTPQSGLVESTLYTFAAEGDKYLSGTSDRIQMAGATYSTSLQNLGTFDSRIDIPATRKPNLINNNGTDIHIYNVGTSSGGSGIINTNEVGARFNFTSNADVYFPSLFVFSTELYLPQLCYDYSIKQDGHYLDIDRDAYPIAQLDGRISSSPLEITVYVKNQEADIAAEGVAIKADVNDSVFDQIGNIYTSNTNGSILLDRGTPFTSDPLCAYNKNGNNSVNNNGCTNGHDIRKGNGTLKAQDYVFTQFTLEPQNISGISNVDQPLGIISKILYYS